MEVKLYLNSAWVTLDSVEDAIQIQSRCDDAFATGSFNAYMSGEAYKYNIPPFTYCQIGNDYYWAKSTCNKFIPKDDTYYHNFEIIELNAILACFIVGTKAFSKTGSYNSDYDKARILLTLMSSKYNYSGIGYTFSIIASSSNLLTGNNEYSFGAGSTLYDCLGQIADFYNARISTTYTPTTRTIRIAFYDVAEGGTYTYSNDNILSVRYSQNDDEYCYLLEQEAKNVVDRNTITHFGCLTPRGINAKLSQDNAHLELPCKIDEVVDFGFDNVSIYYNYFDIYLSVDASAYENMPKKFSAWKPILRSLGVDLDSIHSTYLKKYCSNLETLNNVYFIMLSNSSNDYYLSIYSTTDSDGTDNKTISNQSFSLIDYLLEYNQFKCLTEQEQANSPYYESGGNKIDNLDGYYGKDIWNIVFGQSRNGFLSYISGSEWPLSFEFNTGLYGCSKIKLSARPGIINYQLWMFYVDAYVFTNPMMINKKSNNPLNETRFKCLARTYNNSSSRTDFDRLCEGMDTTNKVLGRTELSIELDTTNATIPVAKQNITYDSSNWYISSVITNYKNNQTTSVLNLVIDYNKKAECIKVPTEFESTKLPLSNIVDRDIIFRGARMSSYRTLDITGKSLFMVLKFTYADNTTKTLVAPCSYLKSNNKELYYYSAMDQYTFNTYVSNISSTGISYQKEMPYVDSNNEVKSCNCKIAYLRSPFTFKESAMLCDYDYVDESTGNAVKDKLTTFTSSITINVYKDAREHLEFTYEVN